MSQKINVLVLPSDKTGVGKFRSIDPHIFLQNLYPDDFHVDIDYEPKLNDPNFWKKYQIVHIHRNVGGNYDQTPLLIKHLKSMGIVVIVDIDDYWLPTKEHPIHQLIVQKFQYFQVSHKRQFLYSLTTQFLLNNLLRLL